MRLTVFAFRLSIAQMILGPCQSVKRHTRLHPAPLVRAIPDNAPSTRRTLARSWLAPGVVFVIVCLSSLGLSAGQAPSAAQSAAKDATSYPAVDAHADDHVAIAADPYDTPAKEKLFRVAYLKYDILPIRIIVTNSGDKPISLDQVRIHLVPAIGDRVQASEPEDVERRVSTRDRVGSRIPIGPISIHRGGKDSDAKIEEDFHEHEYSSLAVEPHTTRAGFLFYDVSGLGKQPLKGAKLLVRRVQDASGKELFYFEIPFDKYLSTSK